MKNSSPIPTYIKEFSSDLKSRLEKVYLIIKSQIPEATETFAYQMPTFKKKKNLIHFAGYQHHIGIYPGPKGIVYIKSIMPNAITSKGTWKLMHTDPIPEKELIQLCRWIEDQP